DRNRALETKIGTAVDDAHSTAADDFLDAAAGELAARDQVGHAVDASALVCESGDEAGGLPDQQAKYRFHPTFGVCRALAVAAAAAGQAALDALQRSRVRHVPACQLHRFPCDVRHGAKPPV